MNTYENQQKLPQLKLHDLKDSIEWYLECLKPLLSKEELDEARDNICTFAKEEGNDLHEKLKEYAKSIYPNSWLMPYSKDIYLNSKKPITLNGNYLLESVAFEDKMEYEIFVSKLISAILEIYTELIEEKLPPLKVKEQLFCMLQAKGFLRGSRVFGNDGDTFIMHEDIKEANSCAIFYENNLFFLDLFGKDEKVIKLDDIYTNILHIMQNTKVSTKLGIATLAFASSSNALKVINEDLSTKVVVDKLNKSLFCIKLTNRYSFEDSILDKLFSYTNDIWPLKAWSISVYQDLVCAFNNEHTYMDGFMNSYLISRVFEKIKQNKLIPVDNKTSNLVCADTNIDQNKLKDFHSSYLKEVSEFLHAKYIYNNIPVASLKLKGINIDSIYQLAFLYANYYTFKDLKTIHESANASFYYNGRTDCIRSISMDGLRFVKALKDGDENLMELLEKASAWHIKAINKSKDFCSIVRHMSGLSLMSDKELSIYKDKYFLKFLDQFICTSSMGNTKIFNTFAFAPANKDGFSIGYLSKNNIFIADIVYSVKQKNSLKKFCSNLNDFFDLLNKVFEKNHTSL